MSPYNFVFNKPVRLVYPVVLATTDDSQLDKKLEMIWLVKKTDNNHDVLYAIKGKGQINKMESITAENNF